VENGGGKNRQVILFSTELFRLPRVGESLGVQFGVAEHFLQGGVIKGTVSGGVESVLRGGGSRFGQWGWAGVGTGWDPNPMSFFIFIFSCVLFYSSSRYKDYVQR